MVMHTSKTFKTCASWVFAGILCGGFVGCTTPQSITIETTPSGAAISIDDEYIGKSPVVYEIDNTNEIKRLYVVAEKQSYESSLKLLKKKKSGMFAEHVFLKLDPSMSAAEIKAASGSSEQQQQTTMQGPTIQGPTIVIPGVTQQAIPPATPAQ